MTPQRNFACADAVRVTSSGYERRVHGQGDEQDESEGNEEQGHPDGCLLPSDGFFEWKAGTTPKSVKTPTFFRRPDDGVFAFAGLRGKDGTCLLLTTTPNAVVAPVHNRMPVMLDPTDYAAWQDKETDPDALTALLRPYPDDELVARRVSTRVNRPANDDPSLVDAV